MIEKQEVKETAEVKRNFIQELEFARSDAAAALFDVQTIVTMADIILCGVGGHPSDVKDIDWVSVFNSIKRAADDGVKKLSELERIVLDLEYSKESPLRRLK